MPDITTLIQSSSTNPWIYLPLAILLGALHALEPGHSKSIMVAFIVAIRGTVAQAVLLGVSAAIGHTIIVWGLALLGLYLGDALIVEKAEPWLVLISGLLIVALAIRLLWAISRKNDHHHHHDHDDHDHHHDDNHGHHHMSEDEIAAKYGKGNASTFDIIWFGFTGGLIPCPAAIAVLLICLQLKKLTLGMAMVAAFSLGLAFTLVMVGIIAAWGVKKASASWSGFGVWAERLPYASALIVLGVGILIAIRGLFETGFV